MHYRFFWHISILGDYLCVLLCIYMMMMSACKGGWGQQKKRNQRSKKRINRPSV